MGLNSRAAAGSMSLVQDDREAGAWPKLPATEKGNATRLRILDAAEIEFGERGYLQASVHRITARAGVAAGTFYLYFRNKADVLGTLVRDLSRRQRGELRKFIADVDGRDRHGRFVEAYVQFLGMHPHLTRLVWEVEFVDRGAYRDYHEQLAAEIPAELVSGRGARAPILIGMSKFIALCQRLAEFTNVETPICEPAGQL